VDQSEKRKVGVVVDDFWAIVIAVRSAGSSGHSYLGYTCTFSQTDGTEHCEIMQRSW
jgi:hypothetical protein